MGVLENLTSIFKVDFSKLKKGFNLKINSDNDNRKVVVNGNLIIVNPELLDSKEKKQFGEKIIYNSVTKDGFVLIEDESKKLLEDFRKTDSQQGNQDLVNYLANKVPHDDIEIIRASLYIKKLYENNGNRDLIGKLKMQIILKHGDRGANISNLVTAGYYESVIKPLYEELSKDSNFTNDKFLSRYNTIVRELPFAVFVKRAMTEKKLENEIISKINTNKKYGIHKLNIHAIGYENREKVIKVASKIQEHLTQSPDIDAGHKYINMTIWF